MSSSETTTLKHLEFIQAVITRMNHCSFLVKGWSVTVVSALLAVGAKEAEVRIALIAYSPAIVFWILDGFFLDQEKRYRKLYELVILGSDEVSPLEMNTTNVSTIQGSWCGAMFTKTMIPFHGVVIVTVLLVMFGVMI